MTKGSLPDRSLAAIADSESFNLSDIAFVAKIPKSTLSRLWHDTGWLDRVSGSTLQQLLAVLPSVGEYVTERSVSARFAEVRSACESAGLALRTDDLRMLSAGYPPQFVLTTLEAAVSIVRLDRRRAFACLARCWGARYDTALDALFADPPSGLLANAEPLVRCALQLAQPLRRDDNSLRSTLGRGMLVHKLTKLGGGRIARDHDFDTRDSAFRYRSTVMGLLLETDDLDLAEYYGRLVSESWLLRRNELWSLASYSADIPATADFSIPVTKLVRTAEEVVTDLDRRSDAYVHYLLSSAIPVLLQTDPRFGGKQDELRAAIVSRIERVPNRMSKDIAAGLVKSLSGYSERPAEK